jgi:hypothetical protein
MRRLEKILNRADDLGMVCLLNYFYSGQDEELQVRVLGYHDPEVNNYYADGYQCPPVN